jgi:hypothetical protein
LFSYRIEEDRELDGEQQLAWRPKVVYHYIQWKNIEPDFVGLQDLQKGIDISLWFSVL